MTRPYGLSPAALDVAFPFHFVLDRNDDIVQVGSSLAYLLADPAPRPFEDVLRLRRPSDRPARDCVGQLALVDLLEADGVVLRGQFVELGDGAIAFVGAPFVSDLETLTASGLRFKHFALHDPVVDYLTLFQTLTASLDDSRALRSSLEEANAELKVAVESALKAQEAAESASRAKSDFLANISHELRTPIASIAGFAGVVAANTAEADERREDLERILQSTGQLGSLVDNLLHFAERGESQKGHTVERFTLASAVNEVMASELELHGKEGVSHSVEFSPTSPEELVSDRTGICRVLSGVIGNALKFTQAGHVAVFVDWADDTLSFRVTDTGGGIPLEMQKKVFETFTQVDASRTRAHGGAGLGLALSRRVARQLGGELKLVRSSSTGSEFVFHLPVDPEPTRRSGSRTSSHSGSQEPPARVLVVEDSADLRRLLKVKLRPLRLDLTFAEDGVEALDSFGESESEAGFDLVLMDMQMPRLDGYAATRRMRELGAEMPIIAMTAHSMREERQRCFDAGCDDFVPKPIDWPKLLRLISDRTTLSPPAATKR